MDNKPDNLDLFDRIAQEDFFALSAEEQASFLEEADLDSFDMIQDVINDSSDFFAAEYEALEVPPMPLKVVEVEDDIVVPQTTNPIRGTEELTQTGILRLWEYLNYRIPVYQVAIAASILLAGIFFFQQEEQNDVINSAFPAIADSTQLLPAFFADTNVMKLKEHYEVLPVQLKSESQPLADSTEGANSPSQQACLPHQPAASDFRIAQALFEPAEIEVQTLIAQAPDRHLPRPPEDSFFII